jgi:type VII secretion-associated serine protease mycosin
MGGRSAVRRIRSRSGRSRLRVGLALCIVVAGGVVGTAAPAVAAAGGCSGTPAKPGQVVTQTPWPQLWLDPERVWPFSTGAGQVVAVLDSGVDGTHPQLRGRVLPGLDVTTGKPDGNLDCTSHGTAVASLIGAGPSGRVGFKGLAPDARILPVRLGDSDPAANPANDRTAPTTATLAAAITWAVAHGATVVDVSTALPQDDPVLRDAVAGALRANVVVVAAIGDQHDSTLASDPPNYPAGYPGVVAVGAVDENFQRAGASQVGPYVDVVAPGDNVLAATRVSGYQLWSGTSLAAGLVAGIVALMRAAAPGLAPADILARLRATADPVPGGQYGIEYGAGLADPYRAVTEARSARGPAVVPPVPAPTTDPVAAARAAWWRRLDHLAAAVAAALVLAALTMVVIGRMVPAGRRRRWRTGFTEVPAQPAADPGDGWVDQPFSVPTRQQH